MAVRTRPTAGKEKGSRMVAELGLDDYEAAEATDQVSKRMVSSDAKGSVMEIRRLSRM